MSVAVAQDPEPSPEAPVPEFRQGPDRRAPRLLLVIDVSGSMAGPAIDVAIQQAIELALVGTDDMEVGVIVFNDGFRLLEGPDGPESFWYRVPDGPNAEKFQAAVKALGTGGGTDPASAVRFALLAETQMLVMITDGGFQPKNTLNAIRAALETLEQSGRPRPRFGIIGLDVNDVSRIILTKIIDAVGGGDLYELAVPKPPPMPDPLPNPNHRIPPIGPLPPMPPLPIPPPVIGPF